MRSPLKQLPSHVLLHGRQGVTDEADLHMRAVRFPRPVLALENQQDLLRLGLQHFVENGRGGSFDARKAYNHRVLKRPYGGWHARTWRREAMNGIFAAFCVTGSWGAMNVAVELARLIFAYIYFTNNYP